MWIDLFAATACGALALHVIARLRGHQPFSMLTALNVDVGRSAPWHRVALDMTVSSTFAGLVMVLLVEPTTIPQALTSGLGMAGVLSTFGSDVSDRKRHANGDDDADRAIKGRRFRTRLGRKRTG